MSSNPFPADDYSDIDRWRPEYRPEANSRLPGPDLLANGSYQFEIDGAELARTREAGSIFKLRLRVLSGENAGCMIERATFFSRLENLNYLCGELLVLGLDADQWGKRGRPLSQELQDACPKLKGLKFLGAKTCSTDQRTNKVYHNLYVNTRVGGKPLPPSAGSVSNLAPTPPPSPSFNAQEFATTPEGGDPPW